jgi:HEAT repeat protein
MHAAAPRRPISQAPAASRALGPALLAAVLLLVGACSNKQKKLSTGGGFADSLMHDVFGGTRDPAYYYGLVRDSHETESFRYRGGSDPYLVDKNIDALQHLGDGPFARLEGQANTVTMLVEVLLEDPSSLARSAAAVALTKIGARLPRYGSAGPLDDGSGLAAAMGELTRVYGGPSGRSRQPADRDYAAALVRQVGDARYAQGLYTKKALQFFGMHEGLISESDPVVRGAIDAALTKKTREAVVYALTAGVEGPADHVRADSIRGLKVLGESGAVETVVERVAVEASARVRSEAAEFFGRAATPEAVAALVALLEDMDGGVRWKAREALTRIAGQDLGQKRAPWAAWTRARWPGLLLGEPKGAPPKPAGGSRGSDPDPAR